MKLCNNQRHDLPLMALAGGNAGWRLCIMDGLKERNTRFDETHILEVWGIVKCGACAGRFGLVRIIGPGWLQRGDVCFLATRSNRILYISA